MDIPATLTGATHRAEGRKVIVASSVGAVIEYYDFFLVGYLVSVLAPGWHLTYGQSAMMLLSSGVGAIVGAIILLFLYGLIMGRQGRTS